MKIKRFLIGVGILVGILLFAGVAWMFSATDIMQTAAMHGQTIAQAKAEGVLLEPKEFEQEGVTYGSVLDLFRNRRFAEPGPALHRTALWIAAGTPLTTEQREVAMNALKKSKADLDRALEISREPAKGIKVPHSVFMLEEDEEDLNRLGFALLTRAVLEDDAEALMGSARVARHIAQLPDLYALHSYAALEEAIIGVLPRFPVETQTEVARLLTGPIPYRRAFQGTLSNERFMVEYVSSEGLDRFMPAVRKANEVRLIQYWSELIREIPEGATLEQVIRAVRKAQAKTFPDQASYRYVSQYGRRFIDPFAKLENNAAALGKVLDRAASPAVKPN